MVLKMEKQQVVLDLDRVKRTILKKFRDLKKSKAETSRFISTTLNPVIEPLRDIKKEIGANQNIYQGSPISSSTPLIKASSSTPLYGSLPANKMKKNLSKKYKSLPEINVNSELEEQRSAFRQIIDAPEDTEVPEDTEEAEEQPQKTQQTYTPPNQQTQQTSKTYTPANQQTQQTYTTHRQPPITPRTPPNQQTQQQILQRSVPEIIENEGETNINSTNLGQLGRFWTQFMITNKSDTVFGPVVDPYDRLKWGIKFLKLHPNDEITYNGKTYPASNALYTLIFSPTPPEKIYRRRTSKLQRNVISCRNTFKG